MFSPAFLVFLLGLSCCSDEGDPSFMGIPHLHGPSEALVKKAVEFGCEVPNPPQNESIHLLLYKVGNRDHVFGETIYQPGEVASIPKMIKLSHEGYLECVARPLNASNSNLTATVSRPHYLKVVEPVFGAEVKDSGLSEYFEGDTLELHCQLQAGNRVAYKWLRDGLLIPQSPRHQVTTEHLQISSATAADSGTYMCVATNTFNNTQVFTSVSPGVVVAIKDAVSDPEIFFTVVKASAQNYSALVTCRSARGALPITFSLFTQKEFFDLVTTVDHREATFEIQLDMEKPEFVQCEAHNGGSIAMSEQLLLLFVPVSGPVLMSSYPQTDENYAITALMFNCEASSGTHPRYQWFLNGTLLENDDSSFYHLPEDSTAESWLMLFIEEASTGTYHCQVSDSFDNSTVFRSNGIYVDREVVNRLPSLVVFVVFGCFATVVLLVSFCCVKGVLYRRRIYGDKSLLSLEMERGLPVYEGEMDLPSYREDPVEDEAAKQEEFDQASEASVDE